MKKRSKISGWSWPRGSLRLHGLVKLNIQIKLIRREVSWGALPLPVILSSLSLPPSLTSSIPSFLPPSLLLPGSQNWQVIFSIFTTNSFYLTSWQSYASDKQKEGLSVCRSPSISPSMDGGKIILLKVKFVSDK